MFLAEDHGLIRSSVRRLFDADSDVEIVGEAASGTAALAGIKESQPDVARDIAMPDANGLELIAETRRWPPGTGFVIHTGMISSGLLKEAASLSPPQS